MAEMDQGLKRLLTARPADILSFVFPGIEYQTDLPTEVATEPQLTLDTLFRVRYEGTVCAVNIEAQAHRDDEMPRRCFEYGARASIIHQMPVFSVVLWLLRQANPPLKTYEMRMGSWVQATWQIVNIEVYNLEAQSIIATGLPGLLPLVPFMRGSNIPTIEQAGQLLKEQHTEVWSDLVSLLAVFTARFHGEAAARAIIRSIFMSTEILDESPLYQAWRAEARAEGLVQGIEQGKAEGLELGKAEGLEQGKAEGIEQGKAEGLRLALNMALIGRFNAVPPEITALIEKTSEATLTAALTHIATDTLEQMQQRLSEPETPTH